VSRGQLCDLALIGQHEDVCPREELALPVGSAVRLVNVVHDEHEAGVVGIG